ncbi:MAG: CBASS oligonucleotide cyclase [Dehalococcoidia bacterium]
MRTVDEAFDEFRRRLELSPTEEQDASRRHKDVRACIAECFDIERDFLTGSYARYTKTKPLKDVDIFFCLGEEDSGWRSRHPNAVLAEFETCLADKYGADSVDRGRRCVTVEFEKKNPTTDKEGKLLSNDAVPAYDRGGYYEIPDRDLGEWIKTDPDTHKEKATAKNNECDGKWVPLLKMLKRWNRSADAPISPSFLIEVMALDLVDPPFTTYPSEVRRFFAAAQSGVMQDWPDPAGYGPPVSDQMTADRRRKAVEVLRSAEVKAARAVHLERQGRTGEALALWREIMGKYLPVS